jgi:ABC-type glycerol-3-phosphate transport system permease component
MHPLHGAVILSFTLFAAILGVLEIGFRWARRLDAATVHEGTGGIEAAVFGLLGLLLAFSFAGAMARLDARRQLIVQEANAIGTAYLRLDVLPAAEQPPLRQWFREYVDARLEVHQKLPDLDAAQAAVDRGAAILQPIWTRAVSASQSGQASTAILVLPALNEMIDVTTSRSVLIHTHLPSLILSLLILVTLLSALLAGYAMARRPRRSWLHRVAFAAAISATVYAVMDLDHPRSGIIRLEAADQPLIQLRTSLR